MSAIRHISRRACTCPRTSNATSSRRLRLPAQLANARTVSNVTGSSEKLAIDPKGGYKPPSTNAIPSTGGSRPTSNVDAATPRTEGGSPGGIASGLREFAPNFTETYVAYGSCENLVKECSRTVDYTVNVVDDKTGELERNAKGEDVGRGKSWWFNELGLPVTFNTWAQVTMLHMWLVTVRLRMFPPELASQWHQQLCDHFFHLAEEKMINQHKLVSRTIRNKYLKDLFVQWRGLQAAYDEGLARNDAVLATAVWRNVFQGKDDVDFPKLAQIVSYMRSSLKVLASFEDDVVARAELEFGDPSGEALVVQEQRPQKNSKTINGVKIVPESEVMGDTESGQAFSTTPATGR